MRDGPPRPARWRTTGTLAAVVLASAVLVVAAPVAVASFIGAASAAGTLSTATLEAPSALTSGTCLLGSVTLSWTATPSTWADGYEIRWGTTNGGPYPNSTTSILTTKTVSGLGLFSTNYFVVRAYDGNWRSPNSNQRTVSCI